MYTPLTLSNLDFLNRDLALLYPRTNVKSIDFAKTIKKAAKCFLLDCYVKYSFLTVR